MRIYSKPPFLFLGILFIASLISIVFMMGAIFSPAQKREKTEDLIGSLPHSSSTSYLQPLISNPSFTPTPSPTPVPYPPPGYHCVKLPILMYHHVEPIAAAKAAGHAGLTVDSGIFATQMQYLADRGYTTIQLKDLASYFDTGKVLPAKAVILTFDDGYSDFHEFAVPIMASHNFVSDLFVSTGLVENPGYLSWSQIKEDSGRGVSIDHHTWSHANVAKISDTFFHQELDIATQQLTDHGYAPVQIFAYPYGTHNSRDITELAKRGFRIAVTTLPGQMQCKEDRLSLHRTRIGNSPLSAYGL